MTAKKKTTKKKPEYKPERRLTFVDLFAGCGGLSLGLEKAGFEPLFVNELSPDAMETYLLNREAKHPLLRKKFNLNDVKQLVADDDAKLKDLKSGIKNLHKMDPKELDLVVGGPPCQGFSGIGHRRSYSVEKSQLPSNHLYQDMAHVVHVLRPKIFLFENVKGLLTSRWTDGGDKGEIWEDVRATFKGIEGYTVRHALVLAKDYGVPQNRPRVLMVGVRDDIGVKVDDALVAGGFLPERTGGYPNIEDLLGDLLDPKYVNGYPATTKYPHAAAVRVQKDLRTLPNGMLLKKGDPVTEHEYSKHRDDIVEKFKYMLANDGEIPEAMQTKKFAQRPLPRKWKENGPTITATSLADDYVHYEQPRTLTVREWARLQMFPDWYKFSGKRTTGGIRRAGNPRAGIFDREVPKYTQIGNAVPVELAHKVGLHFLKILGRQ